MQLRDDPGLPSLLAFSQSLLKWFFTVLETENRPDYQWVPRAEALDNGIYVKDKWPSQARYEFYIATTNATAVKELEQKIFQLLLTATSCMRRTSKVRSAKLISSYFGGKWSFTGGNGTKRNARMVHTV